MSRQIVVLALGVCVLVACAAPPADLELEIGETTRTEAQSRTVDVLSSNVAETSTTGEPGLHTLLTVRDVRTGETSVVEVVGGRTPTRARVRSDQPLLQPGDRASLRLQRHGSVYRLVSAAVASHAGGIRP